jgi:gliding motility-associated lipoprotein GldH
MLKKIFLFTLLSFSLISCDSSRIIDQNQDIPNAVWDMNNPAIFEVLIEDTLMPCNFYVNLRHTNEYAYKNIFFFINTDFPNGEKRRDTLECLLQDKEGRWFGSGLGSIRDHQILFKKGHRFPLKGNYVFTLEQAMREEKLENVQAVGLRIEQTK